jgi:hypothetical protein
VLHSALRQQYIKDNKGKVATLIPKPQEDPSSPDEKPLKKKVKLFGSTGN